ncbi:MAG TPA: hypothetical protein VGC06_03440 [Actinomycetes bacterium]
MPHQTPSWGPPPNHPPKPGWGPPPPQPQRRRPGVVGWVAIGLGVLVVLAVIGSLSNDTPTAAPGAVGASTAIPVTQPPLTAPPTTEVTTTEAPATEPPTTEPPTTHRNPPTTHAAPTTHRPPTTRPAPKTTMAPSGNCDPSYPGSCLHDGIGDYDCAGGSGNGPNYVSGPIRVRPPDPFGLDADGDGVGCED